ncbi:MAG: hypothetical protein J6N56_07950 [Bacteroidales bacterium]|nr:hypothetical protein [Bacteroidales bacterium]
MKRTIIISSLLFLCCTFAYAQNPDSLAAKKTDTLKTEAVVREYPAPTSDANDIYPNRTVARYVNRVNPNAPVKTLKSGIMIIGEPGKVRAAEPYGGRGAGEAEYANSANKYKSVFGDSVNVYCMVIPNAGAFYTPSKGSPGKNQGGTINRIFSHLDDSVRAVDIYSILGRHAAEPIYSRTDHHWAPLGAYYAAKKFAAVAGVPFKDLSHYKKHVIHNYVGTMYMFTKSQDVKNSPEDFVYYTPDSTVTYTTTYINYNTRNGVALSERAPQKGDFFQKGVSGAGCYVVFMGGDAKITQVRTSTRNGRRLIIFKDSYGNAIPGYLFFSFEEIHVIDCRFYKRNIKKYVKENKITDILFANNIMRAVLSTTNKAYARFLTQ